jgi:hypothetical protein
MAESIFSFGMDNVYVFRGDIVCDPNIGEPENHADGEYESPSLARTNGPKVDANGEMIWMLTFGITKKYQPITGQTAWKRIKSPATKKSIEARPTDFLGFFFG